MTQKINTETLESDDDDARAGSVSALMDDALSGQEADLALVAATQPEGEARWQIYHLIGDALRDPGLAARPDAALLDSVRAAIGSAQALTPESAPLPAAVRRDAANDGVFRWKLASGFASVVAVAAIGWGVWGTAGLPPGQQLAQTRAPLVPATQPVRQIVLAQVRPQIIASADAGATDAAPDAQRLALNASNDEPQMLHDPQLDRLLAAHRGMAAFGASPSAFLRSATFEEQER